MFTNLLSTLCQAVVIEGGRSLADSLLLSTSTSTILSLFPLVLTSIFRFRLSQERADNPWHSIHYSTRIQLKFGYFSFFVLFSWSHISYSSCTRHSVCMRKRLLGFKSVYTIERQALYSMFKFTLRHLRTQVLTGSGASRDDYFYIVMTWAWTDWTTSESSQIPVGLFFLML